MAVHRPPFEPDPARPGDDEQPIPVGMSLLDAGGLRDRIEARLGLGPVTPARLVLLALGALVLVAGGWWLLRPPAAPVESTVPLATSGSPSADGGSGTGGAAPGGGATGSGDAPTGVGATSTTVVAELVVQASGAVRRPGVYRLPPDARVDDLVREAGGLVPEADADKVNLAAPLADGERVWVPRRGETDVPEVVAGAGGGGAGGGVGPTSGPGGGATGTTVPAVVDLNSATAEQLDTLPGVGPATASAILAYRDENGPFASVDDLLEVRGIGDAKLEQLRPLVTV
jgi:competence protein ComEA